MTKSVLFPAHEDPVDRHVGLGRHCELCSRGSVGDCHATARNGALPLRDEAQDFPVPFGKGLHDLAYSDELLVVELKHVVAFVEGPLSSRCGVGSRHDVRVIGASDHGATSNYPVARHSASSRDASVARDRRERRAHNSGTLCRAVRTRGAEACSFARSPQNPTPGQVTS